MEIENGDLFVVNRGLELNNLSYFNPFGLLQKTDDKPRYDRSYSGMIFQAEDSAFPMVAAICVGAVDGAISHKDKNLGKPFMFNQYEVELMVISKRFAEKCGVKEKTETL